MREFIVQSRQDPNGKWIGAGITFVKANNLEDVAQPVHYLEKFESKDQASGSLKKGSISSKEC